MTDLAVILIVGALASLVVSRIISVPLAYVVGLAPLLGAVLYFAFALLYGCAQGAKMALRTVPYKKIPRKERQ